MTAPSKRCINVESRESRVIKLTGIQARLYGKIEEIFTDLCIT